MSAGVTKGDVFEIETDFFTRQRIAARVMKIPQVGPIVLSIGDDTSRLIERYRADLKIRLGHDMPDGTILYTGDPLDVVNKRKTVWGLKPLPFGDENKKEEK